MADREVEDITAPAPEEAPAALTVAELRDLISRHALKGPKGKPTRLRMPNEEALACLASIVNHWAASVRQARAEAGFQKVYRDADAAAATLRKVLPVIGARLVAQAKQGNPVAAKQLLPPAQRLFEAARDFVAPPAPAGAPKACATWKRRIGVTSPACCWRTWKRRSAPANLAGTMPARRRGCWRRC